MGPDRSKYENRFLKWLVGGKKICKTDFDQINDKSQLIAPGAASTIQKHLILA